MAFNISIKCILRSKAVLAEERTRERMDREVKVVLMPLIPGPCSHGREA